MRLYQRIPDFFTLFRSVSNPSQPDTEKQEPELGELDFLHLPDLNQGSVKFIFHQIIG